MISTKDLVNQFEEFTVWIEEIKSNDNALFFQPIKEGKWTVAEILSHIMFWDRHIQQVIMPQIEPGAEITNIEFQVLNDKASAYALSGSTIEQLIEEVITSRKQLVQELRRKTDEQFFTKFKLDGEEIDEYSGFPHTLYNYISAFIWHDKHHIKQVEEFLSSKKLTQ